MDIGVGVVGYGYAGRSFHTYLVPLAGGLSLRAVATRDPERSAQAESEHGIRTYATLTEMLGDADIQLVVLATPHHTHAQLAIEAMSAGRHVVVDKAMCLNVREADAMIDASKKNSVMLSVFHNRRWDWDFLTVQQIVHDRLIGDPYRYETSVLRYRQSRGWRSSTDDSGGILYDWGAHMVDQALLLVPSTVRGVQCPIQHRSWGSDAGSYANLTLDFSNEVSYAIEVGNLAAAPKPRWYVLGEQGAIVRQDLDQQERAMVAGNIDAAHETPEMRAQLITIEDGQSQTRSIESVQGSWKSYYQNIADHLLKGASLDVTPEQVRRQIAIFDAAMESAATHQTVRPVGERA